MKFKNSIFLSAAALSILAVSQNQNEVNNKVFADEIQSTETNAKDITKDDVEKLKNEGVEKSESGEKDIETPKDEVQSVSDTDKGTEQVDDEVAITSKAGAKPEQKSLRSAEKSEAPLLVTDKDTSGGYSIDPENTVDHEVKVSKVAGDKISEYFTGTSLPKDATDKSVNPINLDTGKINPIDLAIASSGDWSTTEHSAIVTSRDQIDFKSDFSLNFTTNIKWDKNKFGTWLGGDGLALFFEPLTEEEVRENAKGGFRLGLYDTAKDPGNPTEDEIKESAEIQDQTISFNISTNGMGRLHDSKEAYEKNPDPKKENINQYDKKHWYIYQSTGQNLYPTDGTKILYDKTKPIDDGVNAEGEIDVTFDMHYDSESRVITTEVSSTKLPKNSDGTNPTMTFKVPEAWSGKLYTMAFGAANGGSRGEYYVTDLVYKYTAASQATPFNITSTGLVGDVKGPEQKDVRGTYGSVVAFYPEGTEAPTEDKNGNKVTKAIEVPEIQGNKLKETQYLVLPEKDEVSENGNPSITLNYVKPVTVTYQTQKDGTTTSIETAKGNAGQEFAGKTDGGSFDGYKLVDTKVEGSKSNPTTTFPDTDTTVTFVYEKVTENPVITVNFKDKDSGDIVKTVDSEPGKKGDKYEAKDKVPDGYKIVDNETTNFVFNDVNEVKEILVEKKNTKQTITFIDENGEKVGTAEVEGKPGTKGNVTVPKGYEPTDSTEVTFGDKDGETIIHIKKTSTDNGGSEVTPGGNEDNKKPDENGNTNQETDNNKKPEENQNNGTNVTPEENDDKNQNNGTNVTPEENTDKNQNNGTNVTPEKNTDKNQNNGTDVEPDENGDKTPDTNSTENGTVNQETDHNSKGQINTGVNVTPTVMGNGAVSGAQTQNVGATNGLNTANTVSTNQNTLPQTGEKNSTVASILGLVLSSLGITTLFGFNKNKKRN